MALIACPDCSKQVSDQALTCPYCGLPIAARLAQLKQEEEERLAEEEALRQHQADQRSRAQVTLGVIAVILVVIVVSCISNSQQSTTASTEKVLYEIATQASITPGVNTFEASGKLKLEYACQSNANKKGSVQLTLMNMASPSTVIWKKTVTCPLQPFSSSENIQVKAGSYDVGSSVSGDSTWNMKITQM